jgi:hypothetical protein
MDQREKAPANEKAIRFAGGPAIPAFLWRSVSILLLLAGES